ncbi:PAS domain S-box protein [Eleftheria terrae]|uniref:PAS domain S-box protein n=1 Tax=Eleftheria terrae TaxID=1597781 RepID=UPI00263BC1BB|nr:PAS domain S-box protein [Eleftheria terrae]WKB51262.1 PAS domain S-box protein [Eleftheria terrae]
MPSSPAGPVGDWRLLFERNPLPMWVFSLASRRFLAVNRAAVEHYGYSEAEFLSMTVDDIRPPEDLPRLDDMLRQGPHHGRHGLWRHRRRDGSLIDVEVVSGEVDFDGEPARLILLQDVTEQLRAQERLRRKKALLSLAGSVARLGGWSVALPDLHLSWSDEVCALHGIPVGEAPSLEAAIGFYLPEDQPRLREALAASIAGERGFDLEARLRDASGALRWVRLIGLPERDDQGAVVGVSGAIQDITDRKLAEREARELARQLSTTLESITDAVFTLDHDWRFTYVNRHAEQVLARPRESLLGRCVWAEFPQAVGTVFQREYERAVAQNRAVNFKAYYAPLLCWLEVHAYPSELGLTVYFRDVTGLHEAEQARQARAAAEASSRSKTRFLARLSHEMRTPLNAVLGFAQLLVNRPGLPPEQEDYAQHILRAGHHLLALVNDVLDLQQVEEGRLTLHPAVLDLRALAAETAELLTPLAGQRDIAVYNEVPAGCHVEADEQRLRQVLINLVSNAIKYNRPGGTVRLVAQRLAANRVALRVVDTGQGIAADQLHALFQPFERLGRESSAVEGTGLGLVIARRLVEEMGGHLELQSQLGRGTCAHVELPGAAPGALPASPPLASDAAAGAAPPGHAAAPVLRLLYVEDNPINALLFEEALGRQPDLELRIADSGGQGLALAAQWRPDVLALDANLPDMSGFELLQRLRALPGLADTPAFMCSADALPEDLLRAREAGFAGYWTKPVDLARVMGDLRALRERLAGPSA